MPPLRVPRILRASLVRLAGWARRLRRRLDLETPTTAMLGDGHGDLEDAVREGRLRVLGVDALGQRDGAIKSPVGALAPVDAAPAILLLVAPFTRDDELAVLDLDVDLVL